MVSLEKKSQRSRFLLARLQDYFLTDSSSRKSKVKFLSVSLPIAMRAASIYLFFPCFHPALFLLHPRVSRTLTFEQRDIRAAAHSFGHSTVVHSFIHSFNTFVLHEDTGRLSPRYTPGNLLTVLYNVITPIPSPLFLPEPNPE